MDFEITEYKRSTVIYTSGRIDSYSAPEVEEALNQLIEKSQYNIIFDMRDVNFVSSAGLVGSDSCSKRSKEDESRRTGAGQTR